MSVNTNSHNNDELNENILSNSDAPIPTFNSIPEPAPDNNDNTANTIHYVSVKKHTTVPALEDTNEIVDVIPSPKKITSNDTSSDDDLTSITNSQHENRNWFASKEYIIFKNQLSSLRKNNIFILKEGKECKRLLDLKYDDLTNMVNNIQTSVIFMSTISGFFQATKTQFGINLDIISVFSITISTYISLILSISKYYKLDELKDRIQTLREKYSLLHNRIDYRMDVLGPWNNKHLWEHQDPKNKLEQWEEVMEQMNIDYNEIIKTKQHLTTDFEIIMDTISRNKYNTLNSFLNYKDRETLFSIRQKEQELERRIQESSSTYTTRSRPSIVLQHEELDNWDDESSVV